MATLAEIRSQYPQYQDMSDQQLADGLYNKFYSDMPRDEFDAKVGVTPPSEAMTEALAAGSQASQFFGKPSEPSLVDRGQSFAQGVIDGLPIVGPALTNARVEADALLAQLPGGMTPEEVRAEAADRRQYLEENAGNERLAGNVAGAVVPLAAAGMAAPVVGTALGMTGGLGTQALMGTVSGGVISGADTLARGGNLNDAGKSALIGGGIGGAAPLVMKGAGMLANNLLGRSVPKAPQAVGRALADDGINPANVNAALSATGPGATLMDLGPNLQSQAGALAAVPGAAQRVVRETVSNRAGDAATRVAADVTRNVGPAPSMGALTDQIVAAQKAAADPLYAAVRDVPVPLDGNIQFVASTPLGKAAFERAAQLAANDGKSGTGVTVGFIDYAKQALDDVAGSARRAGENNAARQATQMARMLTAATDAKVPGYRQARDAFAGPAAILDALEEGQGAFKRDLSPESMETMLKAMTTSEKDAYLQGARQSVADLIGNSANDVRVVRDLLRKPYHQAKLRMLIGDSATDDLLSGMERELAYGQTSNVVSGNSETARRAAAMSEVAGPAGAISPQSNMQLAFIAFNKAREALSGIRQGKTNSQMADLLTSSNLTPGQIIQLQRAMRAPGALPIAPASVPQLTGTGTSPENQRKPLEILVDYDGKP